MPVLPEIFNDVANEGDFVSLTPATPEQSGDLCIGLQIKGFDEPDRKHGAKNERTCPENCNGWVSLHRVDLPRLAHCLKSKQPCVLLSALNAEDKITLHLVPMKDDAMAIQLQTEIDQTLPKEEIKRWQYSNERCYVMLSHNDCHGLAWVIDRFCEQA